MPISYKNKIYTTLGTPTVASGNGAFVTNSVGVPAKDYTVKGKTIVWNQMIQNPNFSNTVVDTRENVGFSVQQLASPYEVFFYRNLQGPGLVSGVFTITASGNCRIKHNGSEYDIDFFYFTSVKDHKYYIYFNFTSTNPTVAGGVTYNKAQLFDLTQMFGAGNEPATPAEFQAMFPDDYYSYNAGELKSITPTSAEASGAERFQMLDKSKFEANKISGGVTFTNNGDGSVTLNGTATAGAEYFLIGPSDKFGVVGHKYFLCGCPSGGSYNTYRITSSIELNGTWKDGFSDDGTAGGNVSRALSSGETIYIQISIKSGCTANNLIFRPQLFDLTQMFGAGNEPATPAEFWQRVPEKLYGYNPNAYKSANIPSSKYFSDGMRSAGSAYDEINFLSQKAIKRIGVRAYQTGDENNANVMTDKKNTVYELATPVETVITPSLQALSTYKGFTSFSAPNSLMQNGPLSVTYYAEGGNNPESGWLTSYKRKLYMGRNIEWNQLLNKSGFYTTRTINGVTFTNNGDGTVTANGTATANADFRVSATTYKILANHKCLIVGGVNENAMVLFSGDPTGVWLDKGSGVITNQTVDTTAYNFSIRVNSGTTVSNVIFKPQLFDLTQMFGAGKEPSTPEEFWSYFDHKLYPYNTGETQPLFKISRKSQWGSVVNKGDLINIEGKQYRVLKTNGNVAEVLAMYNPSSTTQSFGTTQIYANSSADTYCNETFYNGLSSALRNAIVEKTFTQDSWFRGSSGHSSAIEVYQGVSTDINYVMSLMNKSFGASITRKCYMISIQDIIDYIGATTAMTVETTTLKQENIWKLFWNQSTKPGTGAFYYPWLRSASVNDSATVFDINSNTGRLDYDNSQNEYIIRPAFQIDLSKISWTPVQAVQAVYAGENTVIPQTVSN